MMWLLIFLALFLFGAAGLLFLIYNIKQFHFVDVLSRNKKAVGWIISTLIVILPSAIIWNVWGYMNAIIILLHLTLFWGILELIRYAVKKIGKKAFSRSVTGTVALIVTAVYLGVGCIQAYHVWQTDYSITTDKNVGTIKIALMADSHVGTTFSGKGLAEHLLRIQKQNPDVLVIAGDFVDEDTTKTDMLDACRALKNVHTKYGIYYVFGNHDKGNYGNNRRGYTGDELFEELERNNVTVLQDENVLIDNRFYLIGRQDASEERDFGGRRAEISKLTETLDNDKYSIILDHQPVDYDEEADSGADLVLSGHTHGGQMIPIMQFSRWFHLGGNDNIYGMERRRNTDFIVTSGISDWAIKFKTGCRSEFVMIEVNGQ